MENETKEMKQNQIWKKRKSDNEAKYAEWSKSMESKDDGAGVLVNVVQGLRRKHEKEAPKRDESYWIQEMPVKVEVRQLTNEKMELSKLGMKQYRYERVHQIEYWSDSYPYAPEGYEDQIETTWKQIAWKLRGKKVDKEFLVTVTYEREHQYEDYDDCIDGKPKRKTCTWETEYELVRRVRGVLVC